MYLCVLKACLRIISRCHALEHVLIIPMELSLIMYAFLTVALCIKMTQVNFVKQYALWDLQLVTIVINANKNAIMDSMSI